MMRLKSPICTAPPDSGELVLGRTLPDLLDEACVRNPNPKVINRYTPEGWVPIATHELRQRAEEIALGLLDLKLTSGDRVALYMHSDADFPLVDMGCQIAHLVDVPVYLTYVPELIAYVINHAEARALVVSDMELLERLVPVLDTLSFVEALIVIRPSQEWEAWARKHVPEHMQVYTLAEVRERGRTILTSHPDKMAELKAAIDPHDVATIIYTSGTTGKPKGVMLTHENLSSNAIASFTGLKGFKRGPSEVALSFLPLTHVFARMLMYGHIWYGTTTYYSHPGLFIEHCQEVRPTIFATVPRVLEKIYERILMRAQELKGIQGYLLNVAIEVARRYDMEHPPTGWQATQLKMLDRLVFQKWRALLGGRLKYTISGGAALRAELANFFAAAGIYVLQGYGLTETSPVITYNRPDNNRPGTVGQPIAGVEVAIAEDGEILTRGPHVMKGYFKNPEATREAIDEDGWFHTGDIGELTEDCFLIITDRKKNMFKLSTGKYVTPQPIEDHLRSDPLVDQAIVVGEGEKFAAVLIFPNEENVRSFARARGVPVQRTLLEILQEPVVVERFRRLLLEVNAHLPHWSQVKRFALVPAVLTIENEALTPTMKIRRRVVMERFADVMEALYRAPTRKGPWVIADAPEAPVDKRLIEEEAEN